MAFKINYLKVLTQDYIFGKTMSLTLSLSEMPGIFIQKPSKALLRLFGCILRIKPFYSMLSTTRLLNLYRLTQEIETLGMEGDIVECGTWNGGASAMIARSYADSGAKTKRTIWLFDSFEGLPPPTEKDSKGEQECYFKGFCKGALENIKDIYKKLGVSMDNVRIVKGWLETTLKQEIPEQIALLHVDTDWYDCVKAPLDALYPKVVPGGFVVVDDYWFHQGCKAAVTDFIKEQQLEGKIKLIRVDRSAVYFQKPY